MRVRQAFAHAIDRQRMVDQILFGQGRAATGPINSQMAFAYTDDVTMYEFSADTANALLDDAGLMPGDDGNRFSVNILMFPRLCALW